MRFQFISRACGTCSSIAEPIHNFRVLSLRLSATIGMSTVPGGSFGATLHGHLHGFHIRPGSHQQNWLQCTHDFTNWTTTAPSYRSRTFTWLRCDTKDRLLIVTRLVERRLSLLLGYTTTSVQSSSSLRQRSHVLTSMLRLLRINEIELFGSGGVN